MSIQFLVKMPGFNVRWYFNVTKWTPSHTDLLLATSCIQTEEKFRINKFVFQKDFKASLIGRLMMRKYVSEACLKPYNSLVFERDGKGRPFIRTEKVSFNVSHQGDFAVLAGESNNEMLLGVDVMKFEYTGLKPIKEFFRNMKRIYSVDEWKQIYSHADEINQLYTFYRLWALKESYTKAIGLGITVKLDEISFTLNSPLTKNDVITDTVLYIKDTKQEHWHFQEMLIRDDHCVAVATNKELEKTLFTEITFDGLMENVKPLIPQDERFCINYFKKESKPN